MNRTLALVLATAALAACSPDFDPASKVDKLRVLAIKADPPEIEPAGPTTVAPDSATLSSLVLRADFDAEPVRTTTIVHLACVPDPANPAPTPCVMLANLRDPAAAMATGAQRACAGGGGSGAVPWTAPWPEIDLAGIEVCERMECGPAVVGGMPLPSPELVVTAAVRASFEALPDGAPNRILGVEAVVLAFALEATPDELVAGVGTTCPAGDVAANLARLWPSREHVLATKRVLIRGVDPHDPEPNHNPDIGGIEADEVTTLEPDGSTTLDAGTRALSPILGVCAPETYTELDASGTPIETKTEEWVYSWFSTAGELDELHTRGTDPDQWTVSAPAGGARALVAAVVRDLRGGVAWKVREVGVAPP